MKIQKILFPTDFSKAATHAQCHAAVLAAETGASLTVLHVRALHSDQGAPPEGFASQGEILAELGKRADPGFRKRIEGFAEKGVAITTKVERGISVAETILRASEAEGYDLIVMGKHGSSAIASFFLGSTAERVVRFASSPVMTIGDAPGSFERRGVYHKVLVPVDFSPTFEHYAGYAAFFASLFGCEIHMIHVIEDPGCPEFYGLKLDTEKLPAIKAKAEEKMKALASDAVKPALNARQIAVREGKAAPEIVTYAQEMGVDLIVMCNRGLDRPGMALMGDTAENILRKAPCPVLTIPLP